MRIIIKYISNNGKEFNIEEEALAEDEIYKVESWYEKHKLYGRFEGCKIEWEDFIEWLTDNQLIIKDLLKNINILSQKARS